MARDLRRHAGRDEFGLKLIAGRDFGADEYKDSSVLEQATDTAGMSSSMIVSEATARKLFPDGGANAVRGDAEAVAGKAPARDYPVGGLTVVQFPNNHMSYLLTWYGLALLVAYGAWRVAAHERRVRRRYRESPHV